MSEIACDCQLIAAAPANSQNDVIVEVMVVIDSLLTIYILIQANGCEQLHKFTGDYIYLLHLYINLLWLRILFSIFSIAC